MPSPVPSPIAAAIGIVPTVLSGVRRLPGKAVQLPILALSTALTRVDAARREYDDLAERGERLIARLRGVSFDELEDRVEDTLKGTRLAAPYDAVEDTLEDLGERVSQTVKRGTRVAGRRLDDAADAVEDAAGAVRGEAKQAAPAAKKATKKATKKAAKKASSAVSKAEDRVEQAAKKAADAAEAAGVPEAEHPKDEATPAATQPDSTRVDTAVTPEVERTVETAMAAAGGGEALEHNELPLPDYDHMTLGSLRGRMRSLNLDQLVQVRDYEKAHADRLPIVTMLDNRIAKLATDASAAQPSGVPSDRPAPGQQESPGGSKVTPATASADTGPDSEA